MIFVNQYWCKNMFLERIKNQILEGLNPIILSNMIGF